MWDTWCAMNKGKEMHVEGVRIKRKGSIVWIAGKCARTVRQVGRAERVTGETWRIRTGTGRDGQGYEGPWGGAAEYRRRRKSGVSTPPIQKVGRSGNRSVSALVSSAGVPPRTVGSREGIDTIHTLNYPNLASDPQ